MLTAEFTKALKFSRIVAVIRAQETQDAVERAHRALDAGVRVLEVAWTTPGAGDALQHLSNRAAVLGAGTITTASQAEEACRAGAQFLVAPNFSPEVHNVARKTGVVYIPGVFTAHEVADALGVGLDLLKLFPAATGGIRHLAALKEPFPEVQWIPTGGVTWETLPEWLANGAIAVGMGTALFRIRDLPEAIRALGAS